MSPTPRAALAVLVVALAALALPPAPSVGLAGVVVGAILVDVAVVTRRRLRVRRTVARTLARGVPTVLHVDAEPRAPGRARVRQAQPPDIAVEPSTAAGALDAYVTARRRGAHRLPPVAVRRTGPLGLGAWTFEGAGTVDVLVYPDVVNAWQIVGALRTGRFRDAGLHRRGPLGLGTELESVRDYQPDDDVRQINWAATARVGRPMSNTYRLEQDRDVVCLLDAGRLMTAPLGALTRLDAAVDAVTAVGLVADEVGDRCGVTVFDAEIRRRVAPRRNGGRAVVRAILDVEPTHLDSDYDLAFRTVGGAKRALVLVCTDLVDEVAARSLLDAVPVIARRHAVVVASVRDPDLDAAVTRPPSRVRDVYATAVALDVLEARQNVEARLRHVGAHVVEAAPATLAAACVRAYLRFKSRARL